MTPRKKRPKAALEFSDITKLHGDVRALGPVDLSVQTGETVALLGHNGSGKSTLLSLAAGVLEPSDGEVLIFGTTAGEIAARAAVSYVRDHPVLYEDLSVREHLEYLSRLHGSCPDAHDADRLIGRLGLTERADQVPSSFSRGLRQKTALAVAFCRPFGLLLIDEPFAGLDPAGQSSLLALIAEASEQGGTVVVATHDQSQLSHFDRAIVLSDGEVIYDGEPANIPTVNQPPQTKK